MSKNSITTKIISIALVAMLAVTGGAWLQNYVPGNFKTVTSYPAGSGAGQTGQIVLKELAANGTSASTIRAADSLAANATVVLPSANSASVGDAVKVASSSGGVITLEYGSASGASAAANDSIILPQEFCDGCNSGVIVGANNQVRAFRFCPRLTKSVTKISARVGTGVDGSTGGLGIYSDDGNTLLASGTINTATANNNTVQSVTFSSLSLSAGTCYLLGYTNTSSSVTMTSLAPGVVDVMNDGTVNLGTAANASSSGVLPATTGAISGGNVRVPSVKIY